MSDNDVPCQPLAVRRTPTGYLMPCACGWIGGPELKLKIAYTIWGWHREERKALRLRMIAADRQV